MRQTTALLASAGRSSCKERSLNPCLVPRPKRERSGVRTTVSKFFVTAHLIGTRNEFPFLCRKPQFSCTIVCRNEHLIKLLRSRQEFRHYSFSFMVVRGLSCG